MAHLRLLKDLRRSISATTHKILLELEAGSAGCYYYGLQQVQSNPFYIQRRDIGVQNSTATGYKDYKYVRLSRNLVC